MSPLYIITVDSLSRRLYQEQIVENIHGISIVKGAKEINCLHFVDDTLVMWRASTIIVDIFNLVLDQFMNVLGSHINKGKAVMCMGRTPLPNNCNP